MPLAWGGSVPTLARSMLLCAVPLYQQATTCQLLIRRNHDTVLLFQGTHFFGFFFLIIKTKNSCLAFLASWQILFPLIKYILILMNIFFFCDLDEYFLVPCESVFGCLIELRKMLSCMSSMLYFWLLWLIMLHYPVFSGGWGV